MTVLLTLARAVHFGSCLLLQSVFAVLFLVLHPAWHQTRDEFSRIREKFPWALHRLLVVCLLLAFVSGFLWLWLAIAGMSGSSLLASLQPALFEMVLAQTQPGRVWMARTAIAFVFAAALFFVPRAPGKSTGAWLASWLGAISATALTASLAWLGHAGAGEGENQHLQLAGDVVHLVAAGIWPAGLVPFAIFLASCLRGPDFASLRAARVATRRFSALSLLAVALLAGSGIANSYFLVGNFHALLSTGYGKLLLLKFALFSAMFAIGGWNLFIVRNQLTSLEVPSRDAPCTALATVARNVWIEIGLGTVVLLVVGLLGILPPAVHS